VLAPIHASGVISAGSAAATAKTCLEVPEVTNVTEVTSAAVAAEVAEVVVCLVPDDRQFADAGVLVVGAAGAGKSTLVGVLSSGTLDNGRGRARLDMFRHNHEVVSGRTSAMSTEVLCFDDGGALLNYDDRGKATNRQHRSAASAVVRMVDTPGHPRSLKTVLHGLVGRSAQHLCLVVPASEGNEGPVAVDADGRATEARWAGYHQLLSLATALRIPAFVVITKIDSCERSALKATLARLMTVIKELPIVGAPRLVRGVEDAVSLATAAAATMSGGGNSVTVPIIMTSCVSGKNMDTLQQYLFSLAISRPAGAKQHTGAITADSLPACETVAVRVEETFGRGGPRCIVAGPVLQGHVCEQDAMLLGPDTDGTFMPVVVVSW